MRRAECEKDVSFYAFLSGWKRRTKFECMYTISFFLAITITKDPDSGPERGALLVSLVSLLLHYTSESPVPVAEERKEERTKRKKEQETKSAIEKKKNFGTLRCEQGESERHR